MIESIFLIALVFLAFFTINTPNLRRAVIYLGIFSLVSSFLFLVYGAPDVAIAEAIIGSTITTVLYLVALKKYQHFLIYYIKEGPDQDDPSILEDPFLKELDQFLRDRNIKPQFISSKESITAILKAAKFDLALHRTADQLSIYGCAEDYQMDAVEAYLKEGKQDFQIKFIRCKEEFEREA